MDEDTGPKELYCPDTEPRVDIVAVHGLGGGRMKTWTSEKTNKCWLSDLEMLPQVVPDARIITYGYNANFSSWRGRSASRDRIMDHAHTLISMLDAFRYTWADRLLRQNKNASERPIIFLCHSLGGIIVKRALTYSRRCTARNTENLHLIYTSTYGILFFGTPHNGAGNAKQLRKLLSVATCVIPTKVVDFEMGLLRALEENSEQLENITDEFAPLMSRYRISFFWEQHKLDLKVTKAYIVARHSAVPNLGVTDMYGIAADHRGMCKFEDAESSAYRTVASKIAQYCADAPHVIPKRVTEEKALLRGQRIGEAAELLGVDADWIAEQLEFYEESHQGRSQSAIGASKDIFAAA